MDMSPSIADDAVSAGQRSATSAAPQTSSKGGRQASDIRKEEFENHGDRVATCKQTAAQCKHCSTVISAQQAKVEVLYKHIISECEGASLTVEKRLSWQQHQAGALVSCTAGEDAVAAGVKRKRSRDQARIDDLFGSTRTTITAQQKQEVNQHFLRWLACNNIPFKAMNSSSKASQESKTCRWCVIESRGCCAYCWKY
jgi:hypothetical protein